VKVVEEERPTVSLEEAARRGGFDRLGDVACHERREGNEVGWSAEKVQLILFFFVSTGVSTIPLPPTMLYVRLFVLDITFRMVA
jgi:hypothetical protein